MEITCPRCESTFGVDHNALQKHHYQVKCGVCQQVFQVDLDNETSTAGAHLGQRLGRYLLLLIIFLLVLALIGQILWSTGVYSYAANSAPIRRAMIHSANAIGTQISWPGPNKEMRIVDSHVTALDNHLAEITGKMENLAGHVQAYPAIQVTLSNVYGAPIAHLQFTPKEYLAKPEETISGFLSHTPVQFSIKSPKLIAAAGYQVTLLSQP
ncbi:zinc-ribbon domain-containing protein [Acidithiobacillus sp. HP-6]|uniref:zinc-ribbon and DUF3426 domain-containing protein n=1 Tax=unclassified Acidithiobacillus TaxID=2614800 RepID=UPI001878FF01|nr:MULTISPECIES: zinc-ribbon and DUF3426 domain-containing protein [unclassified Acidithiobacillus]MBE7561835.1 zinc-ribbon domain-containing protein [Acidithiobacillus sp. HP-6]MBE7568507.1 zinc-ribbon domain-containing protein [Acidithiobacillus sp. HP-2]MDD5278423.1 zinc-ribbon and DUF3426 domain-containing protein [Acidithiobacillus sp.]